MSPWRIPDGQLDRTWNYQSENDRAEYIKAFQSSEAEQRMMAVALTCADPATPEAVIRAQLTNTTIPPRTGYDLTVPGIDAVLAVTPEPVVHSILDFTSDQAALESTMQPSLEGG